MKICSWLTPIPSSEWCSSIHFNTVQRHRDQHGWLSFEYTFPSSRLEFSELTAIWHETAIQQKNDQWQSFCCFDTFSALFLNFRRGLEPANGKLYIWQLAHYWAIILVSICFENHTFFLLVSTRAQQEIRVSFNVKSTFPHLTLDWNANESLIQQHSTGRRNGQDSNENWFLKARINTIMWTNPTSTFQL